MSVRNLRAPDEVYARWVEAAAPLTFSAWAREMLNQAASAEIDARLSDAREKSERAALVASIRDEL